MLDSWINDNTKPLILIGSNSALWFIQDMCDRLGITISGIIDSDYFGNTAQLHNIPVVDTELSFEDPVKLAHYKENYNFFLVTNWFPAGIADRDADKRRRLMSIIDQFDLPCITLIDPDTRVQKSTKIGKNVLIDAYVYISANNIIGDYVTFQTGSGIGYNNRVGRNCVFQRWSGMMNNSTMADDVYVGLNAQIFGYGLYIAKGTVLQPCMAVKRDTVENEVIGLAGKDLRKIYMFYTDVDVLERVEYVKQKHKRFIDGFPEET